MSALLGRLGIEPRAFRALLRAAVRMDLRSQHYRRATLTGGAGGLPPLVWVIAQHLLISTLVAGALFGQAGVATFAGVCITLAMGVLACDVVVEFHEVVLHPHDAANLAHLPVAPRTFAAARLANLVAYIGLLGTALSLPPAVVGAFLPGAGGSFAPAFFIAAIAAGGAATGAVILIYLALVRVAGGRWVKEALAFAQLGFTLVVLYGLQLVARDPDAGFWRVVRQPPGWLAWTPPAWFAAWVEPSANPAAATAGLVALVAVSRGTLRLLTARYAEVFHRSAGMGLAPPPPHREKRRRTGSWLASVLTRSPAEAAAFRFCWLLIRRDSELALRALPALAVAPGIFLLELLSGNPADPLVAETSQGHAAPAVALLYVLATTIPLLAYTLTLSRNHRAA